jgi:hypothetical protein
LYVCEARLKYAAQRLRPSQKGSQWRSSVYASVCAAILVTLCVDEFRYSHWVDPRRTVLLPRRLQRADSSIRSAAYLPSFFSLFSSFSTCLYLSLLSLAASRDCGFNAYPGGLLGPFFALIGLKLQGILDFIHWVQLSRDISQRIFFFLHVSHACKIVSIELYGGRIDSKTLVTMTALSNLVWSSSNVARCAMLLQIVIEPHLLQLEIDVQ